MDEAKEPNSPQKETMLFAQLIELLTQNAVMMLGGMTDRQGRQRPPDLNAAEMMIDLLNVLQAKTKGNLTKEEERMLSSTLYQLQTAFAEVASKSGDFSRARKATEATEKEDLEENESKPSPPPPKDYPSHQGPNQTKPQGIQAGSASSAENKVKYTKKYG